MSKYEKERQVFVPPAFCIDKYRLTAQFNAADWLDAILERERVETFIAQGYIEEAMEANLENLGQGAVKSEFIYERDQKPVDVFDKKLYDFIATSDPVASCRFATVNVKLPDDVLTNAFLEWVRGERSKLGVKAASKVISEAKFRQWHEARLLQYIDVEQWCRINKLRPTLGVMGLIIHPDDTQGGTADRMRKTTKKHIKEIYSKGYKNALIEMAFNS